MNSEEIILSDRESVSGQLVARPASGTGRSLETYWISGAMGLGLSLAIFLGTSRGDNPTDRVAATLALVPLCLLVVDLFILGLMSYRQIGLRALGLPIGGAGLHLMIWAWAKYLVGFEVFYRLDMQNDFHGVYEVHLVSAGLLGGLNILALVVALYEIGVAGQLVGDLNIPIESVLYQENDRVLDGDHNFEVQVLLNNIGYDIGGIDGFLGPKTQAALKQFQAVEGLAPSGVVTSLTLGALYREGQQNEQLSLGQTGSRFVHYWRQRLIRFLITKWSNLKNR